jgi:hypothetical protein
VAVVGDAVDRYPDFLFPAFLVAQRVLFLLAFLYLYHQFPIRLLVSFTCLGVGWLVGSSAGLSFVERPLVGQRTGQGRFGCLGGWGDGRMDLGGVRGLRVLLFCSFVLFGFA